MIQSKYKFNAEVTANANKLAYKLRSKRKDMFINIAVPIALIIMIALLVYDITHKNNLTIDIILVVLLVVIEIMNITMPTIIYKSQKKYLKKMEALDSDYYIAEYEKGIFKEKIYKDKAMIYANDISFDKLVNYAEFEHYIVFIFNNYATLIFDLNALESGTREELIKLGEKAREFNTLKKKKK